MSALLLPIYILIFIGLIYLVGVRPQQKRRKELQDIMSRLQPGDEIVTVSGIYGTITEVEGDDIVVDLGNGLEVHMTRRGIAAVLPPEEDEEADDAEEDEIDAEAEEVFDADVESDDEASVSAEEEAVTSAADADPAAAERR